MLFRSGFGDRLKWVSEPDAGIYNAMNKGMRMAGGDYFQILNSGDCLASDTVAERVIAELKKQDNPSILYGNMIKCFPDGRKLLDKGFAGSPVTMRGMYTGTLNHNPAFIHRSLFGKYGDYDEHLRIVSDWEWYVKAIVIGGEEPKYADINVTLFDMTGISETNTELVKKERSLVLKQLFPKAVLADYEKYSFAIEQIDRLQRHKAVYKLVWFIERCLFKVEKFRMKRKNRIN